MDSTASTITQHSSPSPRRLAELLDEQQEPFVLEIYLLERGYRLRRSLELEGKIIGCCSTNNNDKSKNFLKKSSSYHFGSNPISRKYSSSQFSNIARTLLSKVVSKKWRKKRRRKNEVVESEAVRCSSVSCATTLSNHTWSDSDTDGEIISISSPANHQITTNDQSASDRVMMAHQWRIVEENKQCSPVSVLEEIDLLQAIPVYNVRQHHEGSSPAQSRIRFQKKVSEDAILSASLWELLVQLRREKTKKKPKRKGERKPFPDYMNSKRALQQSRQLLFDCVRETLENTKQPKNSSSICKGLIMGPEEIGKIICKNLKTWGKLSADETNIKQVLRMDLLGGDDWGGFDVWKREIVGEIGNGVVDDITEEIIRELIDQY